MHYFFLEKQDNLTLRWKVRQVAFDAKYRYLYYSKPLSKTDLEEVMTRGHETEHDTSHTDFSSPHSSTRTSTRKVKWSGKVKVTQLRYAADEYIVPPTSEGFHEGNLLTLIIVGFERSLEHRHFRQQQRGKPAATGSRLNRSVASSSENSFSHWSTASWFRSTSRLSSIRHDSDSEKDAAGERDTATTNGGGGITGSSVEQPLLAGAEPDVSEPEHPSGYIHMPSYPVNETLDDDFDDEEENLFRDIDLVPDDEEDEEEETSMAASEPETELSGAEEDEEEESDDDDKVALNSPPSSPTESARSGYSFFGQRRRTTLGGHGAGARDEKTVQVQFRAANYDVFRIVSLRVRQALVRHGLCGPLHAGLPPYDPRNGIALATVPLHLRHAFRRLNDVVFYSLQIGHVVYVRQQREVRGMEGYLCITHDSILLLQLDGKCPRWLDLEDIVGVQYVVRSNHSFISIRAAEPYPDFVFIPIIPSYPPNSTFDAEECVEGIVSMVRRLLMQRLRAGEAVALAPVSSRRASVLKAEDTEEYDILCHIHDLSEQYTDVFKYIAQEQSTGAVPLRWRWDNSKTPTHFTFKRDLYHALEKEEGEDSEEEDTTALARSQRRPFITSSTHAHIGEAVVPPRLPQHQSTGFGTRSSSTGSSGPLTSLRVTATASTLGKGRPGMQSTSPGNSYSLKTSVTPSPPPAESGAKSDTLSRQSSLYSNASFLPATMTQLMAPPSRGAELRAKQRLQVTRTDRRNPVSAGTTVEVTTAVPRPPQPAGAVDSTMPSSARGREVAAQQQGSRTSPLPPSVAWGEAATSAAESGRQYAALISSSSGQQRRVTATPAPSQAPLKWPPLSALVSSNAFPQRSGDSRGSPPPPVEGTASTAAAVVRSPSSRPNTYGLVPSQPHTDPTNIDYWFSSAIPNAAPVATAPKGVQLSDIHSSMQSTTADNSVPQVIYSPVSLTVSPMGGGGRTSLGAPAAGPSMNSMNATAGSISAERAALSSSRSAASAASVSGVAAVAGGRPSSSSAGPQRSATNGSRSPQEVTHTTENVSEEDEESDEDFDSEDMEDMLQRPESRGLPAVPPSDTLATLITTAVRGPTSVNQDSVDPRSTQEVRAGSTTTIFPPMEVPIIAAADGTGGTPGAGTVPAETPGYVLVGDGIVTPAVLTADLLPGSRLEEVDRLSEAASAPSPSLQARPDMVAFIPPAALP